MKKDLNKMSFSELQKEIETLSKKKESIGKQSIDKTPYIVGENYLIRTVTMIYTGKLVKVFDKELVLTNCCWIAETDRWMKTMAEGVFKEVEPYPQDSEVIIGRGSILDMTKVNWKLPDKQK